MGLNRHCFFFKKDTQMVHEHMKTSAHHSSEGDANQKHSEMPFHTKMAMKRMFTKPVTWSMGEEMEKLSSAHTLLVRVQKGTLSLETSNFSKN